MRQARARLGAFLFLSSFALVGSIALDASRRRQASERNTSVVLAVARRLPSSDLALSGGARWLRSPSLVEPSAAFDLGPAMLDPDPGGGLVAPPRDVWALESESQPTPRPGVRP
jgi:hypothetical protein